MSGRDRLLVTSGLGCLAFLFGIGARAMVRARLSERAEGHRVPAVAGRDLAGRHGGDDARQRSGFEVGGVQDLLGTAAVALMGADQGWRVVQAAGCVTATRDWPDGTADTVVLLAAGTGYAVREDSGGRGSPWSVRGSLEYVVNGVLTVLPPDGPDALRLYCSSARRRDHARPARRLPDQSAP